MKNAFRKWNLSLQTRQIDDSTLEFTVGIAYDLQMTNGWTTNVVQYFHFHENASNTSFDPRSLSAIRYDIIVGVVELYDDVEEISFIRIASSVRISLCRLEMRCSNDTRNANKYFLIKRFFFLTRIWCLIQYENSGHMNSLQSMSIYMSSMYIRYTWIVHTYTLTTSIAKVSSTGFCNVNSLLEIRHAQDRCALIALLSHKLSVATHLCVCNVTRFLDNGVNANLLPIRCWLLRINQEKKIQIT